MSQMFRKFDTKYYKVEQFVAQKFYGEKNIMTEFCSPKSSESIKPTTKMLIKV